MSFKEVMERDLDAILNPKEFGEEIIIVSSIGVSRQVFGIFDEEYEVINIESNSIEGTNPIVTIKSADAADLSRRDKVKVRLKSFSVLEIKPDGTGLTTLVLGKI